MIKLHVIQFFKNFYVATGIASGTATAAMTLKDIETWLRIAGLAAGLLVTLLAGLAQAHKLYKQWKGEG